MQHPLALVTNRIPKALPAKHKSNSVEWTLSQSLIRHPCQQPCHVPRRPISRPLRAKDGARTRVRARLSEASLALCGLSCVKTWLAKAPEIAAKSQSLSGRPDVGNVSRLNRGSVRRGRRRTSSLNATRVNVTVKIYKHTTYPKHSMRLAYFRRGHSSLMETLGTVTTIRCLSLSRSFHTFHLLAVLLRKKTQMPQYHHPPNTWQVPEKKYTDVSIEEPNQTKAVTTR